MSTQQPNKSGDIDERGQGAEKIELEKRLDRNAKLEEQAKKSDEKDSGGKPVDR